ncbi:hypothetical protein AVEN_142768-1 [Araneus ventricosus]|uniref:Uncharacterized protein n=1 Tax=Araneus ventricosus TaxID=182803 RepID=A0A4Y2NAX3_ARAVE|nr:hypothetical protein AVEN_16464-1 [Araneus ventricosus]GBN36365.1 hypothetical protein AVEN_46440-1 [Araneus ventricosus]GBN36377.1 hypothetical protein AVEN_68194-1 [Araneus ventricosus]GBN36401.1 hypothetical protein AVEN_142768-1 [Araneus ventricosus]
MLHFTSSDSSAESEIAKAESIEETACTMRCIGGLSVCCKLVQNNLLLPESLMCIVVSSIGCGTITKVIKTPVEDLGLDAGESPQQQTIATCCNVPDAV